MPKNRNHGLGFIMSTQKFRGEVRSRRFLGGFVTYTTVGPWVVYVSLGFDRVLHISGAGVHLHNHNHRMEG